MQITRVRVTLRNEEKLKAFVTITFDGCLMIRHIRVIHNEYGLIVAMPSRELPDGKRMDVACAITQELRDKIKAAVLLEYSRALEIAKMSRPAA